ncbi:hypothetical protein PVT68_07270 [Microbulbifer bruguierae]|uniref:Uncharacterized protein n=1 Tax=Microbulbifer bruguierae TaxID=3029061 RepID=A0ABY8NGM8_9GAMM|nr:hypothetical protein [Microbulbifer bruguierae]WGL18086.1 hypothetical protein PVT68_07270 [Microbulbifer bruguierae]
MKYFLPLLMVPLLCFSPCMSAYSGIALTLSDKRTIEVDLAEAKLISELNGYAIIAGRTCVDCDENTAIFLEKIDGPRGLRPLSGAEDEEPPEPERFASEEELRAEEDGGKEDASILDRPQADATDGVVDLDLSGERFTYPGQYRDYLTRELVEKTRMFYGNCHENSPALLWLSEYRTDKGWAKEEYLLVFRDEGVEHRYNPSRQPSIYATKNANCKELPGVSMTTEP